MTAGGLPEEEYVEVREEMCYFKSTFPLELDTQEFEEILKQAQNEKGANRVFLLWKANELYCGELIPANMSDMWFFRKSKYYKALYMRTVQELYRYDEALDIYNKTVELYAWEMGTPPTKEMQESFEVLELMDENHRRDTSDLNSWQNMDKVFMGRKGDIRRAKERNEFPAVLMFLTLSQKKKVQRPMDLQEQQTDGTYFIGVAAKKFTEDVLQYLFDRIAPEEN